MESEHKVKGQLLLDVAIHKSPPFSCCMPVSLVFYLVVEFIAFFRLILLIMMHKHWCVLDYLKNDAHI